MGGGIFVSGSNTLLCAFMVTLAASFVVLASASTQSPFAQVGADHELLQVMSYEPAVPRAHADVAEPGWSDACAAERAHCQRAYDYPDHRPLHLLHGKVGAA